MRKFIVSRHGFAPNCYYRSVKTSVLTKANGQDIWRSKENVFMCLTPKELSSNLEMVSRSGMTGPTWKQALHTCHDPGDGRSNRLGDTGQAALRPFLKMLEPKGLYESVQCMSGRELHWNCIRRNICEMTVQLTIVLDTVQLAVVSRGMAGRPSSSMTTL